MLLCSYRCVVASHLHVCQCLNFDPYKILLAVQKHPLRKTVSQASPKTGWCFMTPTWPFMANICSGHCTKGRRSEIESIWLTACGRKPGRSSPDKSKVEKQFISACDAAFSGPKASHLILSESKQRIASSRCGFSVFWISKEIKE